MLTSIALAVTPPNGSATYHGVDVYAGNSDYGQIDWNAVAKSQQFAWIKVSEGENYVDRAYKDNISGAKSSGILWGPYQFLRLYSPESCKMQADNFWNRIKGTGYTVIPAVDVESYDSCKTSDEVRACLRAFVDEFKSLAGCDPIIYTYTSYANNNQLGNYFSDCGLWLADYRGDSGDVSGWTSWDAWQYSSSGEVEGIQNHYVDLSKGTAAIFIGNVPSSSSESTAQVSYNASDIYKVSSMPHSYNSVAGSNFIVLDSNGNRAGTHQVDKGDRICILNVNYNSQLAEVVYPVSGGFMHGFIKNIESLLHNRYYSKWSNGSTREIVYNSSGRQIGSIDPREKATVLYKLGNMTMVLYGTSKGPETKSGLVRFGGVG